MNKLGIVIGILIFGSCEASQRVKDERKDPSYALVKQTVAGKDPVKIQKIVTAVVAHSTNKKEGFDQEGIAFRTLAFSKEIHDNLKEILQHGKKAVDDSTSATEKQQLEIADLMRNQQQTVAQLKGAVSQLSGRLAEQKSNKCQQITLFLSGAFLGGLLRDFLNPY